MEYAIVKTTIRERVEREISRIAASSYADDGGSLYDAINITSRDSDIILEYIEGAISEICVRLVDVVSRSGDALDFYLPDFDSTLSSTVENKLNMFIVFFACAEWLKEKSVSNAQLYSDRAEEAITKAIVMLKSRKSPKRS